MSATKTLLGFLAGAAAGALAGILLAPEKGSETRKKLLKKAGGVGDSVKDAFSNLTAREEKVNDNFAADPASGTAGVKNWSN